MSKRIITAACVAVLAAGCGTTQGGTSTSGSSGSTATSSNNTTTGNTNSGTTTSQTTSGNGNTSSQTTSGNTNGSSTGSQTTSGNGSGSTGGVTAVPVTDFTQLRNGSIPMFTQVTLPNATTVLASSYGNGVTCGDGGPVACTQFKGNYYVADSNGNVVNVFKNKTNGALSDDPKPGDVVNVLGKLEEFPRDGGQIEITGFPTSTLDITAVSSGTVPTPDTISNLADLTDANSNEIGRYVTVPAGTYTQDNTAAAFRFTSGTNTYQDGIGLTQGSNTILVETYTYKHSGDTSCYPTDGGLPDLHAGGFNGVVDQIKGDDNQLHKVVFFGNCGH